MAAISALTNDIVGANITIMQLDNILSIKKSK